MLILVQRMRQTELEAVTLIETRGRVCNNHIEDISFYFVRSQITLFMAIFSIICTVRLQAADIEFTW